MNFLELKSDTLSSSIKTNFYEGYVFLENNIQDTDTLPEGSFPGTSETRGNVGRDLFNISNVGPVMFSPTEDDKKQILQKNQSTIAAHPWLSQYPWIYIPQNWSSPTKIVIDESTEDKPIFKMLGKGVGEVVFYTVGESTGGSENDAGTITLVSDQQLVYGKNQKPCRSSIVYPFNGEIYAGTLVQLSVNSDGSTCVIPYQNGRGIPLYSRNYTPNIEESATFPYGQLKWPISGNNMSPSLSPGIETGDSGACVGVVLDSVINNVDNVSPDNADATFKNAPFTVPARSRKLILSGNSIYTQGFLSPGPNRTNNFWAPWPSSFAYTSGQKVPVLTRGITTLRIGACVNVAEMTYGIKTQLSAQDSTWIPVQCIPLFQGERLEAGSYVYASVKSKIIVPGPNIIPDFPESNFDISGFVGQTPWDYDIDATYGNYGVAGIPGLSFSNIPDTTVQIMDTVDGQSIPYLNQANQGSIIVHPVTTMTPNPGLGNSYLQRTDNPDVTYYTQQEIYNIKIERFNIKGVSGRAVLSQAVPDKAKPIGILLETIEGTGKWDYTGLPTVFQNVSKYEALTAGGVSYVAPVVTSDTRTDGAGTGMTITWSTATTAAPYLGTITAVPTIVSPGAGYADGDAIVADYQLIGATTFNQTPKYKNNNAAFVYDSGTVSLAFNTGGSGYVASNNVSCVNVSFNNIYLKYTYGGSGNLIVGATPYTSFPYDVTRYNSTYIPGVTSALLSLAAIDSSVYYQNYHVCTVTDGTSCANNIYGGSGYTLFADTLLFETTIMNYIYYPPTVKITTTGLGAVETVQLVSYGHGNREGDLILINSGDSNAVFRFPAIRAGFQELIPYAPQYADSTTYILSNIDTGVSSAQTVTTYYDKVRYAQTSNVELLPIVIRPTTIVPATPGFYVISYEPVGFTFAYPKFHSNRVTLQTTATEMIPICGGTRYTTDSPVTTYNMTANSLRLRFSVVSEKITAHAANDPNPGTYPNFDYDQRRYTFDPVNGTLLRLLYTGLSDEELCVVRLTAYNSTNKNVTAVIVSQGANYVGLSNGTYVFQTQRLDQVNPTVAITVFDSTGTVKNVTSVQLLTAGTNNVNNDIILITQPESGLNAFFTYNNNMPYIDLPPFANPSGYQVDTSDAAWKKYSDVMNSAVNLLDKQVLVELRPTAADGMEMVYPSAFNGMFDMTGSYNIYQKYY